MKDLGKLNYCLVFEVKRDHQNKKLYTIQRKYVENKLKLFNMDIYIYIDLYAFISSGNMFVEYHDSYRKIRGDETKKCKRTHITYVLGIKSRYMENLEGHHGTNVKRNFCVSIKH